MALSKSQGDDQAAREDAAENQKNGTDDKQPSFSLSPPGGLSDLCPDRLMPTRQVIGRHDRLLVQLSDYSRTTLVRRRKFALCWHG